jgi:hypothetical protein
MRGILRTSLSFAAEDLEAPFSRRDWRSIDGFYLYGQGAVFVISIPGPEVGAVYGVRSSSTAAALEYMLAATVSAPRDTDLLRSSYVESQAALEAGEAEWAEVEEHLAELERLENLEADAPEIEEQIKDAKARAEQRQKEIEELENERAERMARYQSQLHELEERLVEALSGHGDSLSQVAPDEYVTLVLSPGATAYGLFGEESGSPGRIISVKKSTINAYKTGKLSEDGFRKAVLRYTN